MPNYVSVGEHRDFVRAKFEEDVAEGLMDTASSRLSSARTGPLRPWRRSLRTRRRVRSGQFTTPPTACELTTGYAAGIRSALQGLESRSRSSESVPRDEGRVTTMCASLPIYPSKLLKVASLETKRSFVRYRRSGPFDLRKGDPNKVMRYSERL